MNEEELEALVAKMPMNGDLVFGNVMGLYFVVLLYLQQLPQADRSRFLERFQRETAQLEFEVEGVSQERKEAISRGVEYGLDFTRKALVPSSTVPRDDVSDGKTTRRFSFRINANVTGPLPRGLRQRALGILTRFARKNGSAAVAVVCLLLYLSSSVPLLPSVADARWFLIGFFAFAAFAVVRRR